jgi:hypothetical protein
VSFDPSVSCCARVADRLYVCLCLSLLLSLAPLSLVFGRKKIDGPPHLI